MYLIRFIGGIMVFKEKYVLYNYIFLVVLNIVYLELYIVDMFFFGWFD